MMNLLQLISKTVQTAPESIAYWINNDSISYGELWQKASSAACSLKRQGSAPVVVYGHKSCDMLVSMLACLMAKRAYIPVELGTPESRVANIIKMSGAKLLIKNEHVDLNLDIECLDLKSLVSIYDSGDEKESDNKIAYVIFTSGSTGEPKGVPISYDNLDNFVSWINSIEQMQSKSKLNVLNQASFSFDLSVADIYYSLSNGHTLVGLDKTAQQTYDKMFDIIKGNNVNVAVMTTSFGKMLLLNGDFNCNSYPDLKCMYFCGEPLEPTTVKKIRKHFPDISVVNAYGPTEATSAVSAVAVTDKMLEQEYLPVGEVKSAACQIDIVNDEIVLKGKSVFGGYMNGIIGGYFKDGDINCYKTGDCGYIDNGYLYCRGRIDNQIKYMGYRIELGDIENNLLKIEGVEQAVVVAKYKGSSKIVKTIKAFVVSDDKLDTADLKSRLSELLPAYMIPKSIVKLNTIPLNKNGKIDRKRIEEL